MSNAGLNWVYKRLEQIIKNFSPDTVKLNILKGKVFLQDIELQQQFCNQLLKSTFPMFQISHATCTYIQITIPWMKLGKVPIIVILGDIKASLVEKEIIEPVVLTTHYAEKTESGSKFFNKLADSLTIRIESIKIDCALVPRPNTNNVPFKFHLMAKNFFAVQTNENLQPEVVTRTVLRQMSQNEFFENTMVFKKFSCDECEVSLEIDDEKNVCFSLFRRAPLTGKVILVRNRFGVVKTVLLHGRIEVLNLLLTMTHLGHAIVFIKALVDALSRNVEYICEEKSSIQVSSLDTSNSDLPSNNETILKKNSDESSTLAKRNEENGDSTPAFAQKKRIPKNYHKRKDWRDFISSIVFSVEHLVISIRRDTNGVVTNQSETLTLALQCLNASMLNTVKSFTACVWLQSMAFIGTKSVLVKSPEDAGFMDRHNIWATLKDPIFRTNADTFLTMEVYTPLRDTSVLPTLNIFIGEVEIGLLAKEWIDILEGIGQDLLASSHLIPQDAIDQTETSIQPIFDFSLKKASVVFLIDEKGDKDNVLNVSGLHLNSQRNDADIVNFRESFEDPYVPFVHTRNTLTIDHVNIEGAINFAIKDFELVCGIENCSFVAALRIYNVKSYVDIVESQSFLHRLRDLYMHTIGLLELDQVELPKHIVLTSDITAVSVEVVEQGKSSVVSTENLEVCLCELEDMRQFRIQTGMSIVDLLQSVKKKYSWYNSDVLCIQTTEPLRGGRVRLHCDYNDVANENSEEFDTLNNMNVQEWVHALTELRLFNAILQRNHTQNMIETQDHIKEMYQDIQADLFDEIERLQKSLAEAENRIAELTKNVEE